MQNQKHRRNGRQNGEMSGLRFIGLRLIHIGTMAQWSTSLQGVNL
ncbi:MAG: hypothetical protein JWM68_2497 [Verrucomicrobiales bacterium]|nr:hypothetical protein [Verrucomicrobiales bacterium]